MKRLFGFMLTLTMLMFASAVFADHAPPNQTAQEQSYISENVSDFTGAQIQAIDVQPAESADYPVLIAAQTAQNYIAMDSGQGYKRSNENINSKIENSSWWRKNEGNWLHKPGHNHIARL